MYGCFSPVLVYGIVEPEENICVCQTLLDQYDLELFVEEVIKNYATSFVYGVYVTFEQAVSGNFPDKEKVDQFYKNFNTEAPTFHTALRGDFQISHDTNFYDPRLKK
jgi:hypothetical protein